MPTRMTVAEIEAALWKVETKRPPQPDPSARLAALNAVSFLIGFEGTEAMLVRFVDEAGRTVDVRLNPVVAGTLQGAVNGLAREMDWFGPEGIIPSD